MVITKNRIPAIMTAARYHWKKFKMSRKEKRKSREITKTLNDYEVRLNQIEKTLEMILATLKDLEFDSEAIRPREQARIEGGQCM